jgi:hypothetical protein
MSLNIRQEWDIRLLKFLNLLLLEGTEVLSQIRKEKVQLLRTKKELDKIPLCGFKTSPVRLLQWIVEKTFPRKTVRIKNELSEIIKLELVVSSHLEYCKALRQSIPRFEQGEMCESLKYLLESWFVFNFSNYHYRKFIRFPSEVRFYEINQLIGNGN